jgi:hypothetical protein
MACTASQANTTAQWMQASVVLNCAAYGSDLHATVIHQLAVSAFVSALIVPLAAVLCRQSGEQAIPSALLAGGRTQVAAAVIAAYSMAAGHSASAALSEWREAHLSDPPVRDFAALQTLVASVVLLCLIAQAACAACGLRHIRAAGSIAAVLMPFFFYFGLVHALGFGNDLGRMKEVFGHLVIGVGFISFGGTMLCYGPDSLLQRTPIHRFEHRMMIVAGLMYAPMERMMGTSYYHMHFIVAITWAVMGLLGVLLETTHPQEAARGVAFSIALMYHGFMMTIHLQANFTGVMLHVAHGALAFAAGVLRFFGMPRLSGLVLQCAGVVFMCSQKGGTDLAIFMWGGHSPQTYVLLALTAGVLLAVVPTLIVFAVAQRLDPNSAEVGTLTCGLCRRCNGEQAFLAEEYVPVSGVSHSDEEMEMPDGSEGKGGGGRVRLKMKKMKKMGTV